MKIVLNSTRTEAIIEYSTHTFTLSCEEGVLDLVAIWTLPVEAWDSNDSITAERVVRSAEDTAIVAA